MAFALRHGGGRFAIGDLWLLAAVVSATLGYAIFGLLTRQMPGWEVISWAVVFMLPLTLPAALLLWPHFARAVPLTSWAALLYLAAMSMYIGFFAWNTGLALGGVARVAQVQLFQTFVTLAIAAVMLGERIDRETIVFAAAVVIIVFVGRSFRVRPRRN